VSDVGRSERGDALRAMLTGRRLFLALRRRLSDDEEPDPGYRRQPVTFGDPQGSELCFVANMDEVRFPPWEKNATAIIDAWAVYDARRGGRLVISGALEEPRQPRAGFDVVFRKGKLRVAFP